MKDNDNSIQIFCKNTNEYIDVDGGDTLQDVYDTLSSRLGMKPICARVNNVTQDMHFAIYRPKLVEYLSADTATGRRVYIRSLCMMLYKAITDLYPGKRLLIDHSVSNGYYCIFKHETGPVSTDVVNAIKERMRQIAEADLKWVRRERLTADVTEMFRKQSMPDKVRLLESKHDIYTTYYKLDNVIDSYYGPLAPSTGYIKTFDLVPYKDGMLLLGPDRDDMSKPAKPVKQEKMFQAFTDYVNFNCVIGVADVGELNRAIADHRASELINVAEALHNKMFAKIADDIATRYRQGGARVVLIAGPSSSGKTTSSKRLAIQLITNYIMPKVISLDNYFVDRAHTPLDENGDYDYEALHALDLDQFNADITDLIAGKEVKMPTYNFETGMREYRGNTLKLEKNNILLMEGIHGLNPELTAHIPDEMKYRLFVSALTTLNIDDHNWIPTSDNRLLRRIVRDYKYRAVSARDTIARWGSVRRGEEKWIFPYQENADATFNSSLLFELAVMKSYVEPVLRQVPNNCPEFSEAHRLLQFMSYFEPLAERDVPSTSLLREFLGGSSFHY
ncbi:MAG: nucleoside kinase [Sodaliphilus sp.]|nr:nucleoside kinase [Sodaliphilus sp.]